MSALAAIATEGGFDNVTWAVDNLGVRGFAVQCEATDGTCVVCVRMFPLPQGDGDAVSVQSDGTVTVTANSIAMITASSNGNGYPDMEPDYELKCKCADAVKFSWQHRSSTTDTLFHRLCACVAFARTVIAGAGWCCVLSFAHVVQGPTAHTYWTQHGFDVRYMCAYTHTHNIAKGWCAEEKDVKVCVCRYTTQTYCEVVDAMQRLACFAPSVTIILAQRSLWENMKVTDTAEVSQHQMCVCNLPGAIRGVCMMDRHICMERNPVCVYTPPVVCLLQHDLGECIQPHT
eukprot:GDKI01014993.1.p1 GENE.GDKI01014993.1~~GDKI01014993.1.p1  ORF type:complete len:288 (+),score=63.72 GDKI01014993.1:159-1022(+)